jgi:2-desacetyl-2-hydroxyethyl bacteriochlorophyllide A dehydrogenase
MAILSLVLIAILLTQGYVIAKRARIEVLVLDLDGTLYEDDCQIENQIKENCHIWGKDRFNLDPDACQEMHEKWGSTICGVCEELGAPVSESVRQYYNEVYPNMDFGRLRKYSIPSGTGADGSGYSHGLQSGDVLRALKKLDCPIVLASNSPVFHVQRALTRLGIADLNIQAFMTPERIGGILKTDARFWQPLFDLYPKDTHRCSLIDDNGLNIKLVSSQKLGMRGLRITPTQSLAENLLRFLGVNTNERDQDKDADDAADAAAFSVDAQLYLDAKNKVDDRAINQDIVRQLEGAVKARIADNAAATSADGVGVFRVVDLGAGLLSMLPKVMAMVEKALATGTESGSGSREPFSVEYLAFESNPALGGAIESRLRERGFTLIDQSSEVEGDGVLEYRYSPSNASGSSNKRGGNNNSGMVVTVYVAPVDFMSPEATLLARKYLNKQPRDSSSSSSAASSSSWPAGEDRGAGVPIMPPSHSVDLIVGCCVADLVAPRAFAAQLVELAADGGGLLYLPITFAGQTELRQQDDKGSDSSGSGRLRVPSDEVVMDTYHAHLEKCGHHLSPSALVDTLCGYGCKSLLPVGASVSSPSPWVISRQQDPYMFRSMMHFLALGTVFPLLDTWDIKAWFARANRAAKGSDSFVIQNVDLLLSLPTIPQEIAGPAGEGEGEGEGEGGDLRVRFGDVDKETVSRLRRVPALHRLKHSRGSKGVASGANSASNDKDKSAVSTVNVPTMRKAVEFLGNKKVRVVEEAVEELQPGQLLIKTACSVISTGTELKVYCGDVDPDQPADLTIAGMDESNMQYPMRYGYSLVGTVVKVGEGVDPAEWMDKLVFSFSPHSSVVVAAANSVMPVPEGISAEDAAFMPSLETAISLAMSASPLVGERIAVIGQGLIGQLTGSVLQAMNMDVTLVDVSPSRLAAASKFVPKASILNPAADNNRDYNSEYDCVVEVSGSAGGLQSAVDMTGKHGRIVLGSLYGEKELPVKLGLQFHRSGIQLITSQVSTIPPALKGRWTKKRRFDLTWDYIRQLRPSRMLGMSPSSGRCHSMTFLDSASIQDTFRRLERGEITTSIIEPTPFSAIKAASTSPQDHLGF